MGIYILWVMKPSRLHVVPRKREVSGSVGAALRLTELLELCVAELVELELRAIRMAIRTIHARKDLRRAPFGTCRSRLSVVWIMYRTYKNPEQYPRGRA